MARVEPLARARLQDRFEVLAMAKAGWTRYFSRKPVLYPEDIVGMRMAVAPDDDRGIRLFQAVGSRTVKADTPALILQLNTGSIETFYMSPVFVASLWSQFKGKVAYVSPFRMSPFIGAIVVNRASWDKVPATLRPRLREATEAIARQMSAESQRLEDQAMAVLLREGLVQLPYPRDADARWAAIYADRLQSIIAGFFSADMLRTIDEALAKARGGG
jgi:TRAP-type C4-dicarboxylate transport system substrate-binding protein